MGQNTFDCQQPQNNLPDFLSRQLKIYAWRADPNYNSFVSRTFFTDSQTLKQQHKFEQTIRLQNQANYLMIDKLKKDILLLPGEQQQVIMFENYYGCLNRFIGLLCLQEAIYTLYSLLLGYEQIKKMLDGIIVDESCCFVANDGSIRAWINPNFKSNQIWRGIYGERLIQNANKAIIMDILNLVQRMSSKQQKTCQLLWVVRYNTNKGMQYFDQLRSKQCGFADARAAINEFCHINNVKRSRGLQRLIHRFRTAQQLTINLNKIPVAIPCRVESNRPNIYSSIIESDKNASVTNRLLLKSKSLEPTFFKSANIVQKPTFVKTNQRINLVVLTPRNLPVTGSQVMQNCNQRIQQFANHSQIVNRKSSRLSEIKQQRFTATINTTPVNNVTSSNICQQQSCLKFNQSPQVCSKPKNIENGYLSSISQPIQLGAQKDGKRISILCSSQQIKQLKKSKGKKESVHGKKVMQVSLIQNIQSQNKVQKDKLIGNQVFHKNKTARYSGKKSTNEGNFQRSWITTKTITRLISDNESESLENSVKESSDFYNHSNYSGALTHMGRDAKLIKCDKHATLQKANIKS